MIADRTSVKWAVGACAAVLAAVIIAGLVFATRDSDAQPGADRPVAAGSTSRSIGSTPQPAAPAPPMLPHQIRVRGIGRALQPGSCWIFPPTHGKRGITVFLDPGHGGNDPGTMGVTSSGQTVHEKTLTLAVAKRAEALLRASGYTVVMSRTTDDNVVTFLPGDLVGKLETPMAVHDEVVARVACANAVHADVIVSIHFNSYSDPSIGGAETFYDPSRPFSARNGELATLVQNKLLAGFHAAGWAVPDRGWRLDTGADAPTLTSKGAAYGHFLLLGPAMPGWNAHPSQAPGVLIEPLFLTRPTEADVAASAHGQRVMAAAIASAVERFLPGG
ncbi:MAG: N-acetylmuramoyl-L-alanine amidase family protein [Nocardioidaceae bacterium]